MIIVMMRISCWVGIDSFVVVVYSLVFEWFNLMSSIVFSVVNDCLMWNCDIVVGIMVMMIVIVVSMVVFVMMVMRIFKLDMSVFVIMVIGSMFDIVISLMINKLVHNLMMLSFMSFNMWLNLVNGCLFERSMVRVMIWNIDSSQNGMLVVISWGHIFRMIIVVREFWVHFMMNVIFNIWLFVVIRVNHNWLIVMIEVMAIVMVQVMMIMMIIMMVFVMSLNMDWNFMVLYMLNIVVNWLVDDLMMDLVVDRLMMNWLRMVWYLMVLFMMDWAVMHFMNVSVMVWKLIMLMMVVVWLRNVVLVCSPFSVMV